MTFSLMTKFTELIVLLSLSQSSSEIRPIAKSNKSINPLKPAVQNKETSLNFDDLIFPYHSQLDLLNLNPNISTLQDCLENIKSYKIRDVRLVFGISAKKSLLSAGCFAYFSYHPVLKKINFDYQSSAGLSVPFISNSKLRFGIDPKKNLYKTLKVPIGPLTWNHALHNHGATANIGLYFPPSPLPVLPLYAAFGLKVRFMSSLN